MNCLACGRQLKGDPPLRCPGCRAIHHSRAPVAGVNHMSQLLSALDLLAEDKISQASFEPIFSAFVEIFEELEQKWNLREAPLSPRLGVAVERFRPEVDRFDLALERGYEGLELIDSILCGESDDFDSAEEHLLQFFRGICSTSATLLDALDAR